MDVKNQARELVTDQFGTDPDRTQPALMDEDALTMAIAAALTEAHAAGREEGHAAGRREGLAEWDRLAHVARQAAITAGHATGAVPWKPGERKDHQGYAECLTRGVLHPDDDERLKPQLIPAVIAAMDDARIGALEEARGVVEADAAEMERRARITAGQGLDRQTACAATAGRALREAAAGIEALKEKQNA